MDTFKSFNGDLYPLNDHAFEEIALRLFRHQAAYNGVYRQYLTYMGVSPDKVQSLTSIPFLPITLFKSREVVTGQWTPDVTFVSSGTTGDQVSKHHIPSLPAYLNHCQRIFETRFGSLTDFHVFCLLPTYLERTGSSLVAMASHFIKQSKSPESGFYLNDLEGLITQLENLKGGRKVLLLGVSFALLDLAEQFEVDLRHCMIMETGGMKGKRPEITRMELHEILSKNLNVETVFSEYGMTELQSQVYSSGEGLFQCPASIRILLKEVSDPFELEKRSAGVINVIDLANNHTCAFVETQDLGRLHHDGHFEVLGRVDNSDVRGCNLMVN